MGRPKLLLPWGDSSVIECVLAAWRASRISQLVVVVHPSDLELADLCRAAGAHVVVPQLPPRDMKASVQLGLEFVAATFEPTAGDAWLVAPGDMPLLSAAAADLVLSAHQPDAPRIVVPVHKGRRGHPVLFPWSLAAEVARLGAEEGLARLLQRHAVVEVPSREGAILLDFDTPADYQALQNRYKRD
jgi:molybdenum cofactor cytidylyltransferase